MNLEQLQRLPHKWWKKDTKYVPCRTDLIVDFEPFRISGFENPPNHEILELLTRVKEMNGIIPTKFDYLYAINTELMEFQQAQSLYESGMELADIAIFCTLALRKLYNYSPAELVNDTSRYCEKPYIISALSSTDGLQIRLIQMLRFACLTPVLEHKLQYNRKRGDHDVCRY